MCTCITYENGDFYFGRNLDLDSSFNESVVLTPRNFPLEFRKTEKMNTHYAMIGMASKNDCFPLYAEAVNEKGLCMAGLNFPGNAYYQKVTGNGLELASFEVIAWFLGKCASVKDTRKYLESLKIVDLSFTSRMPAAPLHWMLADSKECLVLEAVKDGLKVHQNPFGVLTNNPPFDYHRMNMVNYLNLTAQNPENRFCAGLPLKPYAQGMGAVGLPGDWSSSSRFVRAAFLKWNSRAQQSENTNVSQFFHILDNVAMVRGSVITDTGTCDITTYSCCVNTRTGRYYYRRYDDFMIRTADPLTADLDASSLYWFEEETQSLPSAIDPAIK